MKKIKLNAVLASVLSLGIVCSSSVHASREVEIIYKGLLTQLNTSADSRKEAIRYELKICNQFRVYEKWREEVMRRHAGIDVHSAEELVTVLVGEVLESVLNRFPLLGQSWSPETIKWIEKQRDERFFGSTESIKKSTNDISYVLCDIGASLKELSESEDVSILFGVLREISHEFYSISEVL